jgi:nitrite reductase/ring-hydroxylating ferredoxin subunit
VQNRIAEALAAELHGLDPDLELRGMRAWNRLMMVLLETLARPYGHGREAETFEPRETIDDDAIRDLAVDTYERGLGMARTIEHKVALVGATADIPNGTRRVFDVDGLSVGVFHHSGQWFAMQNSCLHRGGPVCTGTLEGDTLTCPWHGYQYDVTTGELLLDRNAKLPTYRVELRGDQVYVHIPVLIREEVSVTLPVAARPAAPPAAPLAENEVRRADLPPGQARRVMVGDQPVAVYNVDGQYCATQETCTHVGGPLSQGDLKGKQIICPWHASCFDVTTGAVECGPATVALKTYRVEVEGEVVRVKG